MLGAILNNKELGSDKYFANTNVLTKIPQDITLVLNNGIYVKSGSKIYYPDGTSKTLESDTSTASGGWGYQSEPQFVFCYSNGSLWGAFPVQFCQSGSTFDSTKIRSDGFGFWFDTTNNVIKWTNDGGSTFTSGFSLPLGIVTETTSSQIIDRIDQVFNGFGYIDSTVFVLPGVEGLIPNGRNSDGSLKSTKFKNTIVRTMSKSANLVYGLRGNAFGVSDSYSYNEETNQNLNGGSFWNVCVVGKTDGSGAITFNRTLHNVDYKDFEDLKETNIDYKNISNVLINIPQDINYGLSNGTFTLYSGSKVYVPNGSKYDEVRITSNLTCTGADNQDCMIWYDKTNNILRIFPLTLFYASTTAPTEYQYMYWWDLTNNKCKITADTGATWTEGHSLPLGIVATDGSKISGVTTIFNGFGCVGSAIFALPGVKCMAANGFNKDGSYNNYEINITYPIVRNFDSLGNEDYMLWLTGNYPTGQFGAQYRRYLFYDPVWNKISSNGEYGTGCIVADFRVDNHHINKLTLRRVKNLVSWTDDDLISHQSMPSIYKYKELTLGVSGTTYYAPADGYFYLNKLSANANECVNFTSSTFSVGITQSHAGYNTRLMMPVSKNAPVTIYYDLGGTTNLFRFIYNNSYK